MTVLLYRCVRAGAPVPHTAVANVRGPVSLLVLSCQPALPFASETMFPSSAGLAVAKTQASQLILPDGRNDAGAPRSTYAVLPLKDSAVPNLPEFVQVVLWTVPVRPLPDASAVVVPLPSFSA